jgi:hypothetical protein
VSGYGGQPPSGWQDPYDPYGQQQGGWQDPNAQQGGWQDPYAQQSGWQQPPGYGYGPPGVPPGGGSNGSAIGAMVCNCIALFSVLFCCLGAVASLPGAILAGMALGRTQTNPESARQLTLWSWACFGLSIILSVGMIVILIALGKSATPNYY